MSTTVLRLRPRFARPGGPASTETALRPDAARQGVLDSRTLLGGKREILIEHAGGYYRLRHTRNDKLI
ncbi:MAG TPA: hemin uptake protein HemP, partial [Lysobacter sp.]